VRRRRRDVLKRYHPHGDSGSVRLARPDAQTFSMRYPLIDGQGNFGSIDGDPPAAYRYTECRLTRLAERMLADIDKDTVDFVDNFDGSQQEPGISARADSESSDQRLPMASRSGWRRISRRTISAKSAPRCSS